MALRKYQITLAARAGLSALPDDAALLATILNDLDWVADQPLDRTEAPPFPHRQDRMLRAATAIDSLGDEWLYSAMFGTIQGQLWLTTFAFARRDDYPDAGR